MAGVWARSDATRGVLKAPANEVIRGAISLELILTKGEHDQLNPVSINCIRAFPGRGIRVWGARTLSSDPAWRYLNVRRLFNYVEESIFEGTQWVVFEANDIRPWGRVRRTNNVFRPRGGRDGRPRKHQLRQEQHGEHGPGETADRLRARRGRQVQHPDHLGAPSGSSSAGTVIAGSGRGVLPPCSR